MNHKVIYLFALFLSMKRERTCPMEKSIKMAWHFSCRQLIYICFGHGNNFEPNFFATKMNETNEDLSMLKFRMANFCFLDRF